MVVPGWPTWGEGAVLAGLALLMWGLLLFVLARGGRTRVSLLAAAAMGAFVVYFLGQALGALAPDLQGWVARVRATWWGIALAPPLWLLLTRVLVDEERDPAVVRGASPGAIIAAGALGVGVVFAVLGSTTELVRIWGSAYVRGAMPGLADGEMSRQTPLGPLYPAYGAFVLVCLGWAAVGMARLWRASPPGTPLRTRFGGLLLVGALYVVAAAYLLVAAGGLGWSGLPAELLLAASLLLMGWNVARYGALVAGEVVTADFASFWLAMLGVAAVYGGLGSALAWGTSGWLERGLVLALAAMATHVAVDTRGVLDRLIYGPVVSGLRDRLRGLAARVGRQPDDYAALVAVREGVDDLVRDEQRGLQDAAVRRAGGLGSVDDRLDAGALNGAADVATPADLRLLVEGALRRLNDLPALSRHDLLAWLPPSERGERSALELAAHLRGLLEQSVERLRPPGPRPSPGGDGPGGWLHYLVLREAYVDGRQNKQIMQRYYISEGTFHRARRRAIDAVARDLHQQWRLVRAAPR